MMIRVLIIEDNPDDLQFLLPYIKPITSMELTISKRGDDVDLGSFHIVLSDHYLDPTKGMCVLDKVRDLNPSAQCAMMTGQRYGLVNSYTRKRIWSFTKENRVDEVTGKEVTWMEDIAEWLRESIAQEQRWLK